ncbi:MAG: glycoside hydrolase family 78 protein [Kiritimatiellae bacterium]|nr:glycoside hydrolase family 78 protein [Kiritimatiellia bacterium]
MNNCLLAAAAALCAAASVANVTVENLRVCHLVEPSDIVKPVFSWQMRTERKGAAQKAYEIVLRTASGEDVWRSGKVCEATSHAVPYTGPALKSATRYVWSVVVTDDRGREVSSEPATFTTGLIAPDDWSGSDWIAVPNAVTDVSREVRRHRRAMPGSSCFAKRLRNGKDVKEAWWTVTGQGVFQAYVNGRPLPGFLKPGFDHVLKTRHSFTFDVTGLVNRGADEDNVLSSIVTAGWWRDKVTDYRGKESAFRAQLILRYADGTQARFGTDESWRGGVTGPVKAAGIFDGEEYDAREKTPWMTTGEDAAFAPVKTCREFKGEIVPMEGPAVSLREDLRMAPRALYVWKGVTGESEEAYGKVNILRRYEAANEVELKAGETLVVDFGQNAAAVPEFRFAAREGTRVVAKAGEMLCDGGGRRDRGNDGPEGSVYRGNLRVLRDWGAKVEYVFSGDGDEFYRPAFTYLGYRYLSVTATDDVSFREIASVPVSSVTKASESGRIETGVADVNKLVSNVLWSQYSNYLSVPTDCPQRDERLGWTADAQVFCAAASRNADVYGFLRKWMRDMRDSQHDGGSFVGVAPPGLFGDDAERFGWGDAGVIVPYTMWKRYGDVAIVEENFAAIERYMALTARNRFDSPAANEYQWGDWVSFEPLESHDGGAFEKGADGKWRPRADALVYWHFLGGCYWLMDAQMCSELAEALGKAETAAMYRAMADEALAYVRRRFLEDDGMLPKCLRGMQTPALFALKFGVLEKPDAIAATKDALLKNIQEHGDRLQTGFLGTPIIMDVLTYEVGRPDVAYTLLLQRNNPSWLHSVEQGATTIWERWNGYSKEAGFLRLSMKSYNHYAYGAVLEWMYGAMAGIQPDPKSPGWRHFVLAPKPDRRIGKVAAHFDSPYGRIESSWSYQDDGSWKWRVTVPPNTTATVETPDGARREVAAGEHVFSLP